MALARLAGLEDGCGDSLCRFLNAMMGLIEGGLDWLYALLHYTGFQISLNVLRVLTSTLL